MLYRNTKTGVIVDVQSEVHGDWEAVKPPVSIPVETEQEKVPKVKKPTKPKKKK